jgi:hypothetical protein
MSASLLPDKAQLSAFIDAIFRHCDPAGRVAFKAFDGSDKPVFTTSTLTLAHATLHDAAFNLARAAATCGRTAVFCPPLCSFRDTWEELGKQSTATDAILEGPVLSVDADASPTAAWEALVAVLGEPTLTVLSGGEWVDGATGEVQDKVHMHWRLDLPARGPEALAQLHEARWLACKIAGGDGTGAPVAHPLRWPGSVHNKAKPRLCTIGHQTENEISLIDALAALRAAWSGPGYHERTSYETTATGPRTADDADVASALAVIPNSDLPWPEWKKIGMAVWAATSGGGFALFEDWSRGSSKFTPKGTAEAWKKIDRSPPSSLGVGSLFYLANEFDPCWSKPSEQISAEDADFVELRAALAQAEGHSAPVLDPSDDADFAELRALRPMAMAAGVVESIRPTASAKHDPEFPDHLTRVPGLLGDIVDWIEASSRQPSRAMALGAAFTTLGTLMGQRAAGPTESGTHLYTVVLAPSAVGKERPRQAIISLLKAANAAERIGHDEFMSQSALIKTVVDHPCCACMMDEFGSFLRKVFNPRGSSHELGISGVLRKLWGLSFETYKTPIWANGHSSEVEWPALSIYGSSTPDEFFGSIRRETIQDGFLNRLLLLRHTAAVRERDPLVSSKKVPNSLAGALVAFNSHHAQITAHSAPGQGRDLGGPYEVMSWANDSARDIYAAMQDDIFDLRQNEAVAPFYGRTGEMAVRLATIHAAGRWLRVVDVEAIEWGRDVARWSADQMLVMVGDHMAENSHADHGNRIVRYMRTQNRQVTRSDLSRHLGGSLKVKDLTDVLDTLLESRRILQVTPAGGKPGPGRPATAPRYRLP